MRTIFDKRLSLQEHLTVTYKVLFAESVPALFGKVSRACALTGRLPGRISQVAGAACVAYHFAPGKHTAILIKKQFVQQAEHRCLSAIVPKRKATGANYIGRPYSLFHNG
ncbi:MAG TPA: hypothetical protein VMR70_05615 [Flavisolibacter sp.]|nr:hypothetical protein [Flavisolibacter sp.]